MAPPARQFYAERLADGSAAQQLAAALDGLGEAGAAGDAPLAAAHLANAAPAVRCAALRALTDLAVDQGITAALAALDDPSSSVHATAVAILRRRVRSVDVESLGRRARASSDPRRRLRTLGLLAALGKWDAAAFLIEALEDPDAAVRTRATQLLSTWHRSFNHSQAEPSPAQCQRLQALLDAGDIGVPGGVGAALRFALKGARGGRPVV
jgi:HEAT repeat protein